MPHLTVSGDPEALAALARLAVAAGLTLVPDDAPFSAPWDGSKHPRGEAGRWAAKGEAGTTPEPDGEEGDVDGGDPPLATDEEIARRTKQAAPRQIRAVNAVAFDPRSEAHVEGIARSMREEGWLGPPLLVMRGRGEDWQAWTGSHRLAAAGRAGLDSVPVVFFSQGDALGWARAAGYDPEDDSDFTDLEDEDRLAILRAADMAYESGRVAAELMRREVEKWE